MGEVIAEGVKKYVGPEPGPTVAVFAGVHGDERAGIMAMDQLSKSIEINCGVLYLVLANPPAVEQEKRYIAKNLNRCFGDKNQGTSYEDKRANQLIQILSKCEALLDLHAFKNEQEPHVTAENEQPKVVLEEAKPFVICESDSFDVAKIFDVEMISSGWTQAEPGAADGYMHKQAKVGICLECGPIKYAEKYKDFALKSVIQFLKYYEMVESDIELSQTDKKHIQVKYAQKRISEHFVMDGWLRHMQKLDDGQLIAFDGNIQYRANKNDYIIFPDPSAKVGDEVFIIGGEIG
ncbi:MAG: succinylglutamate desuccinylase/aspartoacylase family protein [Patescibacteria group bacterium]